MHDMPLVSEVDFAPVVGSSGTCHYPGMLVPELAAPVTTTSRQRASFEFSHVMPLKVRAGGFSFKLEALGEQFGATIQNGKSNSTSKFYAEQEDLFNTMPPVGPNPTYKTISNVQGSNGAWKSDRYASELLGHTLLASFLSLTSLASEGIYEMDFTGGKSNGTGTRKLKDELVTVAPASLLRCKAELVSEQSGGSTKQRPALTKITVYSLDGKIVLTATPADGVKWELAKIVLHGMGAFVLESFHTAVHLLAAVTTTAAVRSLPRETLLNGIFDAQNTHVVAAIWAQMSSLHNDAPSMWNGVVYDSDIQKVRLVNVKIARYLLQADPREFLSLQDGAKPEWWAGGAANFIAPIETFARKVAQGAIADAARYGRVGSTASYLHLLQQQLLKVGALGEATATSPSLDVRTERGLETLYANMVFYESVFHGAIFATREYFLPIAMPMTSQFLPYLADVPGAAAGVETVEDAINKFVSTENLLRADLAPIKFFSSIIYSTGSGYDGAVEISDGPYYNTEAWAHGESHIATYQAEVSLARAKIMGIFGTNFATVGAAGVGFLPGYYYPADAAKPSGYLMCETVYI